MRRILIYIACLCSFTLGAQQEILNTQFGYNKLAFNAAYSGIEKHTTISMIVRDQWNGIVGAPTNQLVSASIPFAPKRIGIGIIASRYTIGIQERITFRGMYAYRFDVGPGKLSLGLEASGRRYVTDFTDDRLLAIDGIDPDPNLSQTQFSNFTFNTGFGAYFKTKSFYASLSSPRLIKVSFDENKSSLSTREVRHIYAMIGNLFELKGDWNLSTQILYKKAENAPYDLDLQTGFIYKNDYHLGINYRLGGNRESAGESVALLFGISPFDPLFIGFSYDFTLSSLRRYDTGSLELLMQYSIGKKATNPEIINPRFF